MRRLRISVHVKREAQAFLIKTTPAHCSIVDLISGDQHKGMLYCYCSGKAPDTNIFLVKYDDELTPRKRSSITTSIYLFEIGMTAERLDKQYQVSMHELDGVFAELQRRACI